MAVKTIPLKLHNPSKYKRALIDDAIERYTLAFASLIDGLRGRLEEFDAQACAKISIRKFVDKEQLRALNEFGVQPFKDALLMDAGMTLAAYAARKKGNAPYPLTRLGDEAFDDRFAQLCDTCENRQQFYLRYDALLQKHNALRPLLFCRYDTARDYCLLYDPANNRFYAKLYLLSLQAARQLPVQSQRANEGRLRYVDRDATPLAADARQKRYIVVPLEFGRWQEQYLQAALEDPSILKTASLIKKGKDYYLNVKLSLHAHCSQQPTTFLGVCRGLNGFLHYTVANFDRQRIESGTVSAGFRRRDPVTQAMLHKLSGEIVAIAKRCNSRIVLYALGGKKDGAEFGGLSPRLTKGEYNAIASMVKYKAELAGLVGPVTVSPVGVFHTCPICGKNSRKNRMSEDVFLCTNCGYSASVEGLGSENLAQKILDYRSSKIAFSVEDNGSTVRFYNKALEFDIEVAADRSMYSEFYEFLARYVRENVSSASPNQKRSMLKKLLELEDISQGVRFVSERQ